MKKALYPGTFDPITNGHTDIIKRATHIFDEVIVAVAASKAKKPMFSCEKRVELVQMTIENLNGVVVKPFNTLLVDFAKKQGITNIIRGLRAVSDFEYELQMGYANSSLDKNIETMYFMPTLENAFISSSVVRSLLPFGGKVSHLVPKVILEDIPTFLNFTTSTLSKLEKLFYFVANTLPSNLNYSWLAKKLNISKDLLETVIFYLDKIWVLNLAIRSNKLSDILRKEFKIFLWNPNMYFAYLDKPSAGIIRESFVLKILKNINYKNLGFTDIILPNYWDFLFEYKGKRYLFEVGWANKTNKQVKWIKNSFVIADDILIWEDNKIPMWLLGLIS